MAFFISECSDLFIQSLKIIVNGYKNRYQWIRPNRSFGFSALVDQGLLGSEFEVIAINDLVPSDNLAYLLKYDSTQGRFNDC